METKLIKNYMNMPTFSQRYKYEPLEKAVIRECMPVEVENSLCTAFDMLRRNLYGGYMAQADHYKELEKFLWLYFLNERLDNFTRGTRYETVATNVIKDKNKLWYKKIDMVELAIRYLKAKSETDKKYGQYLKTFKEYVNGEFQRHNYSYRIVDTSIVEITSKDEKESVETAIAQSNDNVKMHLTNALVAYAKKPVGDYSGSIKESISAVEAVCREMTGESTLGSALKAFEKNGLAIPKVMKDGLEKLYAYTNQPTTGIRHALMDADGKYIPGNEEARYMLIACSAFINYLRDKCK